MPVVSLQQFQATKLDYLIVGGGTSGLVLAARLSEDPTLTIGVIEAGEHHVDVPEIDIPGIMGKVITDPKYDWTFFSVPQERANGRVVLQPRGKGLGGSSLINFMGMFRPSKEEYDALEELGNPGWNWDEMLKYMKKSENTALPNLTPEKAEEYAAAPDMDAHGTGGPLTKSFPLYWNGTNIPFLDTLDTLGVHRNMDNGKGHTVGSITSWTSVDPKTAIRTTSANAYFEPNAGRNNLVVLTGAQVTKITLEQTADGLQRATGAEFIIGSEKGSVSGVKKDVIISCGSFQTPQVLELSGIGDKALLEKFGIEVKVDLPGVGENLQDHVMCPTIIELDEKYESVDLLADPIYLDKHQMMYKNQEGILTSVPAQMFAFLPAKIFGSESDVEAWKAKADAQAVVDESLVSEETLKKGLQKQYELQRKWFGDDRQAWAEMLLLGAHFRLPDIFPTPGKAYTTLLCALMHPLSRGSAHISSADPLAPPAIDPNYFANPVDLDVLASLVGFALRVFETGPFGGPEGLVKRVVVPGEDVVKLARGSGEGVGVGGEKQAEEEKKEKAHEALKEYVKSMCLPVFHPVGTASMLPKELGGVVDPSLKVYGTTNLRVVDLSILPMELSCHTQSAAFAVGEKAADIIIAAAAKN